MKETPDSPHESPERERRKRQILNAWMERQKGKPQYRPAPSAGMAVSRVMRPLSKKYGGGSSALALSRVWPEIMGARWAKISSPVRFTGGKDGRTLIISAPGPAAALITAQSAQIIQRLNGHLGAGHVARIRLVQSKMRAPTVPPAKAGLSPRKEQGLQEGLSKVENAGLKQALEKLGRGVLKDQI